MRFASIIKRKFIMLIILLPSLFYLMTRLLDIQTAIPKKYSLGSCISRETESLSKLDSSHRRQLILLLSVGRSGSSFTSAIINNHPDVFFVFEPLHALRHLPLYRNETDGYLSKNWQNISQDIIESFFTCNLLMDHLFVFDDILFHRSNSTNQFFQCFKKKTSGYNHLSCFYQLLKSCQDHKMILVKTIRFPVKWTNTFFKDHEHFKLLFLVRDPRATLYSQSTAFHNFDMPRDIVNISRVHCQRLEEDLKETERLKQLFPDRVKGIRYEDGAMDPYTYTKDIYRFLHLNINETTLNYVRKLTNAVNEESRKPYDIERNATQVLSSWRSKMPFDAVKIVDEMCGHLYSKLGYKFIKSHRYLNSNTPLIYSSLSGGIF